MVGRLPAIGGVFTAPGAWAAWLRWPFLCVRRWCSCASSPALLPELGQRSCSVEEHGGSDLPCVALTDASCLL